MAVCEEGVVSGAGEARRWWRSNQISGFHSYGHSAQNGVRLAQITLDIGWQLQPKGRALELFQFVGRVGGGRVCVVEVHVARAFGSGVLRPGDQNVIGR